jgi:hypothetical protein
MIRKKKIIVTNIEQKKYKITYSLPGVNAQLSFDTTDTDENMVRERFNRLFKELTIISVEEIK